MHMKKQILCTVAALVFLLAAGCGSSSGTPATSGQDAPATENSGTEAQRPDVDDERIYSIPMGDAWFSDKNWVLDKDGNEVIPKDESSPDYTEVDLTDLATGEIRYRYRMRDEIYRDEQGYPQTNRLCSLYDLNGNQLIDWEGKSYRDAFGEYVIRQNHTRGMASSDDITSDFRTSLYHVPTGTESYEGTFGVAKLDGGNFLLLDSWNTTLCVVNTAGEAVSGFPMPNQYYSAYMRNGYLTANSLNPNERTKEERGVEYILDGKLQEIFAAEWISEVYGALRGNFFAYHNGEDWGIYQPEKGVVFTTNGASIEYYDGELAIIQTGSFRGGDPINAALVTQDKKVLAGDFSWLMPTQIYEEKDPSESFFGILDGRAVLIDRDGNELASSPEIPGAISLNMLCDGLYTYYVEDGEFYGTGLLGPDLDILIPAETYTWISLARGFYPGNEEWDGSAETVMLEAQKEIRNSNAPGYMIYRMDILDHTGKLAVDNITNIYDVGPDRIALRRGFDVGLMDWSGKWIAKRRIFTVLGDD